MTYRQKLLGEYICDRNTAYAIREDAKACGDSPMMVVEWGRRVINVEADIRRLVAEILANGESYDPGPLEAHLARTDIRGEMPETYQAWLAYREAPTRANGLRWHELMVQECVAGVADSMAEMREAVDEGVEEARMEALRKDRAIGESELAKYEQLLACFLEEHPAEAPGVGQAAHLTGPARRRGRQPRRA